MSLGKVTTIYFILEHIRNEKPKIISRCASIEVTNEKLDYYKEAHPSRIYTLGWYNLPEAIDFDKERDPWDKIPQFAE